MYHIARQLNYHPFPLYRVFLQTRVKWWWSLLCNIIPREGQQIIPHFTTPSNPFLPYMHYAKQAGFSDNMPLPCISISNCPNIASKIYFNLYFTIKTDKVKNSGWLGLIWPQFHRVSCNLVLSWNSVLPAGSNVPPGSIRNRNFLQCGCMGMHLKTRTQGWHLWQISIHEAWCIIISVIKDRILVGDYYVQNYFPNEW